MNWNPSAIILQKQPQKLYYIFWLALCCNFTKRIKLLSHNHFTYLTYNHKKTVGHHYHPWQSLFRFFKCLQFILLNYSLGFNWKTIFLFQDMQVLKDNSGKGDWYSEVLDLRRKASEYRHRANDTHFSANHMAQLLADETRLWEYAKSDRPVTPKADVRHMRPAGISYNRYSYVYYRVN